MIRAKFRVDSFTTSLHRRQKDPKGSWRDDNIEEVEMRTIKMSPVYHNNDPEHENTKFWDATPSGSFELGTVNPEAWKHLELGKTYYIDIHPAENRE